MRPVVTATTELFLLLPVANAFGTFVFIIATLGIGSPFEVATLSTIPYNFGSSYLVTTLALEVHSTILSEK